MKKLLLLGAGGFAREVVQYVKDINQLQPEFELLGYIDEDVNKHGKQYEGIKVLGDFHTFRRTVADGKEIYCVCPIGNPKIKGKLVERASREGLRFTNIIHPSAYLGESVRLGEGIIIGPQCILTVNISIGNHVSVNPGCGIGHDSAIEEYTTLYWHVNISGNVKIGKSVEVGSQSFIKQGINIGDRSIIGAGAVVVKDIVEGSVAVGVPARTKGMMKND